MSSKHARFSPSKLENLSLCPCFEYKDTGETADEGKLMHKALETGDDSGLDEEQALAVQAVRDVISNTVAGMPGAKDLREVEVTLTDLTYGFVDVLLVSGTEASVIDAKFGRKGATDAGDNFQIRTYCAAVLEMYPDITKITGKIVAPRTDQLVTSATFDRSLVPEMRKRIEDLFVSLNDPFKKPCPNPDLCALCANAQRCPVVGTTAVQVVSGTGLPVPSAFAPDAIVLPEDRSVAQQIAGALENWAEQVKKNNLEFVKQGGEIPGYKLNNRSTGYRVPKENTADAWQALCAAGYLSQDEILSAMSMSVPDLAKKGSEVRGTKDAVEREQLYEILEGLGRAGETQYLQKLKKSSKK